MHALVYLNGEMVEAAKARVAAISPALLFGRGVFTIVPIYSGKSFLWPEHWRRLREHANKLRINCKEFTEESVGEALRRLISVNRVTAGIARVILNARNGRSGPKVKTPVSTNSDLLITTADRRNAQQSLTLAVSPYRVTTLSPLTGIKSLNYLDHVLSWEEARAREFDEAVMLNERGEIVSATMANIFWVKEGTVHTPTLSTGAVAGVTRGAVIDLARKHFIPLVEGVYELADLTEADEIFLTSSSVGVAVVTTFDFRQYAVARGTVGTRLREEFQKLTVT